MSTSNRLLVQLVSTVEELLSALPAGVADTEIHKTKAVLDIIKHKSYIRIGFSTHVIERLTLDFLINSITLDVMLLDSKDSTLWEKKYYQYGVSVLLNPQTLEVKVYYDDDVNKAIWVEIGIGV